MRFFTNLGLCPPHDSHDTRAGVTPDHDKHHLERGYRCQGMRGMSRHDDRLPSFSRWTTSESLISHSPS